MSFSSQFLKESQSIIGQLDTDLIEDFVEQLSTLRTTQGRLFILGVGGSAANASHAVNDFRKIVGIESYAPTDNCAELTARTNDQGWSSVFVDWLRVSRLSAQDAVLVLSVGGGSVEKNISTNLVSALQFAKEIGAKIWGIVSRDGGFTATVADLCVIIPVINAEHTTPHAETFQSLILHLLVSHPKLKSHQNKWESVA